MKTLPTAISDNARGGTPFLYVVDIIPRGGDTWSQFRWADEALTIDGDAYSGGILSRVTQIRHYAKILDGGGAGTIDAVRLTLANKNALHNTLQQTEIKNRDIKIRLAAKPTNLILNSSFENDTASDFDYWTETKGDASNSILATTGAKTHGAQSLFMSCVALPAPKVECDTFQLRAGSPLTISFDAKGSAGGETINLYVKIDGKYWNDSTGELQAGSVAKAFTITSAFDRYTVTAYDPDYNASAETVNCSVILELPDTGEAAWIDAVVGEARNSASAYHGHRDEMTASELEGVYYGKVGDYKWDKNQITINTRSITGLRHRPIPTTILNEALNSDYVIPPDNIGKPVPMTYGVFAVDPLAVQYWLPENGAGALGILANWKDGTEPITVLFDNPGLKLNAISEIYHYTSDGQRFIPEMYDDRGTPVHTTQEWVKDADTSKAYSHADAGYLPTGRFPLSIYLRGRAFATKGTSGSGPPWASDHEDAIDNDCGQWVSVTAGSPVSGDSSIAYHLEPIPLRDIEIYAAFELIYVTYFTNTGTIDIDSGMRRVLAPLYNGKQSVVSGGSGTPPTSYNNIPWCSGGQETAIPYTNVQTTLNASFWSGNSLAIRHETTVTWNSADGGVDLRELGVLLHTSLDILEANIYARLNGREYQDTWGGRKTAGNTIENPADVIESIFRDELSTAGSNINTTKFDAASTATSSQKAAGQAVEIDDSLEIIAGVGEDHGILYQPDRDGTEAVVALRHDAAADVLTEHDFADGSVVCEYAADTHVYNDFVIRYGYNPTADEYTQSLYCNKDGQNIGDSSYATKCQNSHDAIRGAHFKEFFCRWINDDDTAKVVLKWLIDWTHLPRLIVSGTCFLDALKYEIGDLVQLDLPDLLASTPGDADAPVFMIYDIKLRVKDGKVAMKFLEVKEP